MTWRKQYSCHLCSCNDLPMKTRKPILSSDFTEKMMLIGVWSNFRLNRAYPRQDRSKWGEETSRTNYTQSVPKCGPFLLWMFSRRYFPFRSFRHPHFRTLTPTPSGYVCRYLTRRPASVEPDHWLDSFCSSTSRSSSEICSRLSFPEEKVATPRAGMLMPASVWTTSLHKSSPFSG